ncbi:DNA polymerase III subunit delta' C-terminal domain-containing protein, partial [Kaarinaea lacus]
LKTLEEPTPGSLLMLVTSQPSRLLPTIRSRCQAIEFLLPGQQQTMTWLSERLGGTSGMPATDLTRLLTLAGGAPLLALQYAQQNALERYQQLLGSFEKLAKNQADPVVEAKAWEAVGLAESVKWMYLWVCAMIRFKSGIGQVDNMSEWQEPVLEPLARQLDTHWLYHYLDKITDTLRFVNAQVNVQLTLEDLLIDWQALHR